MSNNTKKVCHLCQRESLPRLRVGVCRYHWALANWGRAWADNLEKKED